MLIKAGLQFLFSLLGMLTLMNTKWWGRLWHIFNVYADKAVFADYETLTKALITFFYQGILYEKLLL